VIVRVWRGRTSVAKADEYERFLKDTAYPDYGGVPGNRGWILLRRPASDAVEFMFVSFWDSMEALRAYTGGDPERPKYYPEDRAALLELPERVEHYDAVDVQAKWQAV
jgi:heme-degrading monooxygenase HmoA